MLLCQATYIHKLLYKSRDYQVMNELIKIGVGISNN